MYLLTFAQQRLNNKDALAQSDRSLPFPNEEMFASLATQNVPREDSDQTANARTDLNLRRVHMSEGTFSDVAHISMYMYKAKSFSDSSADLDLYCSHRSRRA